MSTTHIAGPSHIIKRPRLTKILDETEARIILLCAPAGYGKTTLAREWVATRAEPVFWYSGGPAMADVAALAVDLAELFDPQDENAIERVRQLAARNKDPRFLARALSAEAPDNTTTVVIDDYHNAARSPDAESLLQELVAHSAFRLLITTREQPTWIDARAIMYGNVELIAQERLAFTPDEAAAVLPGRIDVLDRARGWPAVIGLAATTNAFDADSQLPLEPKRLYDFVAADLFNGASAELQFAIMALAAGGDTSRSIAHDILGAACDAVLAEAFNRGFLIRNGPGWIAIHPLLRVLLVARLGELAPQKSAGLILSVLTTLRKHGAWEACLALQRVFPHRDEMVAALETALPNLLAVGRAATVAEWVELAAVHGFSAPIFDLGRAEIALRDGNNVYAIALAVDAARRLDGVLAARAHLVAARAGYQQDEPDVAAENAARAAELATTYELRTESIWLALINTYDRDIERSQHFFEQLKSESDPRPDHGVRVACAEAFLAIANRGDARIGLSAAARAEALAANTRDPLLQTNALNIHSHLLRLCAEYEPGLQKANQMLVLADETGLEFVVDHALLNQAGNLIGLRKIADAKDALRQIERRGRTTVEHIRRNAVMHTTKLKIASGDIEGAAAMLDVSAPNEGFETTGEYRALRSLVAAALGDIVDAEYRWTDALERSPHLEAVAYVEGAKAIVAARCTSPLVAAGHIMWLLKVGMADAVITACRAFPELAAQVVSAGEGVALERVLSRSRDIDLGRRAGLGMPRELTRGGPLSPRELEVFDLLVQGRSNPEIARALFISDSTAKIHIRHIFEKLGVHTRAEAAALVSEIRGPAS